MNSETEIVMTKSELDATIKEVATKTAEDTLNTLNSKFDVLESKINEQKANPYAQRISLKEEPTFPIGRLVVAKAYAERNRKDLGEVLIERADKYNEIHDKATLDFYRKSIGSVATGGGFSDAMTQSEYIKALAPLSVVRSMPTKNITLSNGGTATYNKGVTGATAYWLGTDSTAITASSITFGQTKMYGKKLAGLVSISNDDIRFDVRSIEQNVQNELIQSLMTKEEIAFLQGDGGAGSPTGLLNLTTTNITMTATPTAVKAKKDLFRLIKTVLSANVSLTAGYWLMNTNVYCALMAQTDSNSNPMDYAKELQQFGTIYGYKVAHTTNIDATYLGFVNASDIVIGTGYGLQLELDTSYGFNTDSTYIRGIQTTDIALTNGVAGAFITDLDWSTTLF